jgi:flavin reductase (DIM6/NTAB) family NADH-FMN oxidoreductase RutF
VKSPIAWVSSIGIEGHVNLAPYSHFNIVAVDPPMMMFAPSTKDDHGTPKDTLRNVTEVPEFVINIVSYDERELMNLTSKMRDHGINEFEVAGLATAASIKVRPPRVAQCRAALECLVWKIVELPKGPLNRPASIVIGEVVGIHVRPLRRLRRPRAGRPAAASGAHGLPRILGRTRHVRDAAALAG